MDYEKKYKETIEKARSLHDDADEVSKLIDLKEEIEAIFPELAESEGEKIRKWLIRLISTAGYRELVSDKMPCSRTKAIAWLEKQGEQKPNPCENCGIATNNCQKFSCAIRDGEQKPTNTSCILSWTENEEKMLQYLEGVVKDYWAKAEQEKNEIKIKEASNVSYFLKTIQKSPLCWIKCSDGLPNRDGIYLVVTDVLHNKVYDIARYDSIKGWHKASEIIYWMPIPQLNNKSIIEQKPADKVEPKFKIGDIVKHKDNPYLTYILKRFTDDGDYEFHAIGKDGHEGCTCFSVVKYQDEWELVEQKPTWSEEDEEYLKAAIWYAENPAPNVAKNAMLVEWVKNLKGRVLSQPKQEWSEEDRKMMRNIIDDIHCGTNFNPKVMHAANEREKWFKSICMRYQSKWKPSEEQLNALKEQCVNLKSTRSGNILCELYSKLIKL